MTALLSAVWKALSRDKHSAHTTIPAPRMLGHGVLEIKVCLKKVKEPLNTLTENSGIHSGLENKTLTAKRTVLPACGRLRQGDCDFKACTIPPVPDQPGLQGEISSQNEKQLQLGNTKNKNFKKIFIL